MRAPGENSWLEGREKEPEVGGTHEGHKPEVWDVPMREKRVESSSFWTAGWRGRTYAATAPGLTPERAIYGARWRNERQMRRRRMNDVVTRKVRSLF